MSDFQYNEELSATMGLVKSQSAELDRLRAEVARLKDEQRLDRQHIANLTELNKEALETNARHMAEVASLKEERDALRRKIFTNTNGEFTLENRTFSIEGFDFILDNNFDFDAGLNVSGDFGGDEKRHDYMQMICNALNSHYALTQQLAAANGRVEKLENALSLAVGMIGHPDNIALLQAALTALPQQVKSEDARDDALQEKTK